MRKPAVAGMFYPKDAVELKNRVRQFLRKAKQGSFSNIKAIIVPHAGYIYSGIVAASAYNLLKNTEFESVIVLGPSHHVGFLGAGFDTNTEWQTPLGVVRTSSFPSDYINKVPTAHEQEHSIEVQLPFIQCIFKNPTVIPISLSQPDTKSLAKELEDFDKSLFIVSSDLSHYLPYDTAVAKDNKTIQKILALNPSIDYEEACGADGINTIIMIARKKGWKVMLLDYKNSGDTSGDKSAVVGYAAMVIYAE